MVAGNVVNYVLSTNPIKSTEKRSRVKILHVNLRKSCYSQNVNR